MRALTIRVISIFAVSAGLALCLALPSHADIYKYVDENGVMHFSNVPTSNKYKWTMRESSVDRPGAASHGKPALTSYDNLINSAATRYGLDPALIKAVIKAESDFNPYAVSRAGARGLMQLMPATARLMGVRNIHDPYENVDGGAKYLKRLLTELNWNLELALAAYNAGIDKVRQYGTIPPYNETRTYVKRVLRYREDYRSM
jgi:soluble lytic murein transglycosylase